MTVMPWVEDVPQGKGLLMLVLRCLYARAAGNHAPGTSKCRIGAEVEPPA